MNQINKYWNKRFRKCGNIVVEAMADPISENGGGDADFFGQTHQDPRRRNIDVESLDEVKSQLDDIQDVLEAEQEYPEDPEQTAETSVSLEMIYKSVVLATIVLGIFGLAISVVAGGYGFTPIFVIGLLFLIYAYRQPLPSTIT